MGALHYLAKAEIAQKVMKSVAQMLAPAGISASKATASPTSTHALFRMIAPQAILSGLRASEVCRDKMTKQEAGMTRKALISSSPATRTPMAMKNPKAAVTMMSYSCIGIPSLRVRSRLSISNSIGAHKKKNMENMSTIPNAIRVRSLVVVASSSPKSKASKSMASFVCCARIIARATLLGAIMPSRLSMGSRV